MVRSAYRAQVDLLLDILPHIAGEHDLVLKGGTAINLFIRDLPRLSVDIDLTYRHFQDNRTTALNRISECLDRIERRIYRASPTISVTRVPAGQGYDAKLNCQSLKASVKIEVNTVSRGLLYPARLMQLSQRVQLEFEKFTAMEIVSHAELYGGKICAALDRQHPRNLFDIHLLLRHDGFTAEVKRGFLFFLLCHPRPIHELLSPNWQYRKGAFETQFKGMAFEPYDYQDFFGTIASLMHSIKNALTVEDKRFLLTFSGGNPDWSDFSDFEPFPAIKWKLQNIRQLSENDKLKFNEHLRRLSDVLEFGQ